MMKRENTNFFVPASWAAPLSPPDAPPGFPPKPPRNCASPASADTLGNHNPASGVGTVGGGAYRDGSVSPERLSPRRTLRKRSRPHTQRNRNGKSKYGLADAISKATRALVLLLL
ncbi:RNA-binding KH domain-containing protein [Striga asiatica]|uniref:RNA-binding KH domain-containing protein n=1 Tax=Striga asiatica TaxID=4170 RepID=A0A5A7QRR5_STRAF|nr:RNA-binding KH domain-containing protein [Striga asiatica]